MAYDPNNPVNATPAEIYEYAIAKINAILAVQQVNADVAADLYALRGELLVGAAATAVLAAQEILARIAGITQTSQINAGALVSIQEQMVNTLTPVIESENDPTGIPATVEITDLNGVPISVGVSLVEGAGPQTIFAVLVTDTAGYIVPAPDGEWYSTDAGVVTVNASTGAVTPVAAGTAAVGYRYLDPAVSDETPVEITVTPAAVASVDFTPVSLALTEGGSDGTFVAQPRDAAGNALPGRVITAPSTDTNVATTSVNGYVVTVTPVGAGSCSVTATCSGTPSAARTVTVAAAGDDPDEPVGYARVIECALSALPTTTRGATGMLAGVGQCERTGNQSIVNGKYQLRFPATLAAGTDPGNLRFSHDTGINDPTNAFYMRVTLRPGRSTADGGDDAYQNHQVDTKICHFKCFALGGGTGAAILRLLGQSPGNSIMQTFRVDVLSKQANIAYGQNINTARLVVAGQDNQIKVQCVMNSAADVADGVLRIWVNGTLVTQYTNVVYKTASSGNVGFYDWWFDNTYGGTKGGAPPNPPGTRTRVDYWTLSDFYVSQP